MSRAEPDVSWAEHIIGAAPKSMCSGAPDGYTEIVVDAFAVTGSRWRLPTDAERQRLGCRWTVGPGHLSCKAKPVAMLDRGYGWWAYCGCHLYGRRLDEHGRLLERRLIADGHQEPTTAWGDPPPSPAVPS